MLPFRLTCLGPPQLVGPDGDPVRFRTRKHLGLLIFLTIEPPRVHRRDRLATLLWPQVELEEGRHSLATALSVLRGRLGADAFETTRDTIRLLPGRVVTDVSLLVAGDPLEGDTLVAGCFLEEFEIPRAPDFRLWLDVERARLLPLVHDHLAARIDQSRRSGDTRRLEATAEQLRRIDPLSEEATRALVEARAMAGDRIGAIRIYDRWHDRLAEELGAVPSAGLQRMADRLRRRGVQRPAPARVAPVPTEQWQERVFVGRSVEYRDCYQVWERVRGGEPGHVLVRGESGIGKTTLVGRVATSLALEGASVARAQCYELERELPFGVIGSLVGGLLDLPGASTTAPEQLAELGRLVAKVRQRWPGLPAPSRTTGESARIQLTEAVMALLAALAEEQPVVVVIDDLHLADTTSLAVLHLLLRRIEALPLMVMMTVAQGNQPMPAAVARFTEQTTAITTTVLPLGPLPEAHAGELLEAVLADGADPGPTVRRALLAGAAGNPIILELLVGDWRRRGDASLALTLSAMTADAAQPAGAAFRRLVDGMLASLDQESRAVADLAAILGQRLNDLAMYTLVDLPVARTMRAMAALTGHRVLRDAGSHLEFANEVVRGQCYLAMAAPLRRLLHSLVADRLLAEEGVGGPIPGLEVAWHLVRGDRLGEAVPYLLAGGREAIRRGAPHEADLALSTGLPALTGAARRTAILLLAEALQELGRWAESLRVLEASGEEFDPAEESWREVLRILNRRWLAVGEANDIRQSCNRALSIAQTATEPALRAVATSAMVALLSSTRDPELIRELDKVSRQALEGASDPYDRIHLLLAHAWCCAYLNGARAALEPLRSGVALIESTGTASSIATRLLLAAGVTHCQAGDYEAAAPLITRAYEFAKRLDNPVFQANAASGLALVHGRLGNHVGQVDWARLAISISPSAEWGITLLNATYELSLGLALQDRGIEATGVLAEMSPRFDRRRPSWIGQAWHLIRADIYAITGDNMRAVKAAAAAVAVDHGGPLHECFVGPYARWVALLGKESAEVATARNRISTLVSRLSRYDAKDQAEILAAELYLRDAAHVDERMTGDLAQRLTSLPRPIRQVIIRTGVMRPTGAACWGVY